MTTREDRFWAKVDHDGPTPDHVPELGPCWIWTASKDSRRWKGYGFFWDGKRQRSAHRFSWELAYGAVADGMFVLHRCDNPSCIRPEHLFLGTHQDNMHDRDLKHRTAAPPQHNGWKTHCPQGHPYAGDNLYVWRGERGCMICRRHHSSRAKKPSYTYTEVK